MADYFYIKTVVLVKCYTVAILTWQTSMSANVANLVNNTTWSCPGIESALILPVRVMEASNNIHICMGFWIVFTNGLYFVPMTATSVSTKIVGSNYVV